MKIVKAVPGATISVGDNVAINGRLIDAVQIEPLLNNEFVPFVKQCRLGRNGYCDVAVRPPQTDKCHKNVRTKRIRGHVTVRV